MSEPPTPPVLTPDVCVVGGGSAGLVVAGRAATLMEGADQARKALDSGAAAAVLDRLVTASNA